MSHPLASTTTKAERRRALPLRFKLGCWLLVVPLFAASFVCIAQAGPSWWLGVALFFNVAALAAYAALEIRSVEWLKRNGHL
jgi:hypothetical protein